MNRFLLWPLLIFALCGCHPDTQQIGQQVATLLQQKINEDTFLKKYGLVVTRVEVIREEGNKYKGVAVVTMQGKTHDVGLNIVADGDSVMYETDPAPFLFVIEQPIEQSPRVFSHSPQIEPKPIHAADLHQTQSGGVIGEFQSKSR